MLNLYWKIFLGFWLTGLLLGGGAALVSQKLRQDVSVEIRGLSPSELVNRTAFIIRRLPEDFDDWQTELAEHDIFVYLDNRNEESLSTPNLPDKIVTVFNQLKANEKIEISSFTRLSIGKKELAANGKTVNFVIDMPGVSMLLIKRLSEQFAVQLILALTLSAAACFMLARYLTRHLDEISRATRALASGNLDARAKLKRSRFKDEFSVLAEDFNHMAHSLKTSIENQRRLVRDISHELRSPLARLQIALELARQNPSEDQFNRIELEANRLNDMIGQILNMPDNNAANKTSVNVTSMISELIDDNQIEAAEKQVSIELNPNDATLSIPAVAQQLHSAFENVLRNAIHYTNENSTIIISIQTTDNKNSCHIDIDDNGPGVPDEDLLFIFEPFYRVDPARNRKTGGYGVGLAIVKRVIESHEGSVSASNLSNGLRVSIMLPLDAS